MWLCQFKLKPMKVRGNKLILTKKDLKRRLVIVKGIEFEEQMAGARDACKSIAPDAVVIKEESLDDYNKFRTKNGRKPLPESEILMVDLTIKEEDLDE